MTKKKGRKAGAKLEQAVTLFNRWNCNYYQTIKGETTSGNEKVVGRDYSVHQKTYLEKHDAYVKAHDSLITKFLKTVKRIKFKEDLIRDIPYFMILETVADVESKVDLFEPGDITTNTITDKEASLARLDKYYSTALEELEGVYNRPDLAKKLTEKWNTLKLSDSPVGKELSQSERISKQLDLFKW